MKHPIVLPFLVFSPLIFSQTKPDALMEYRIGNFEKAVSICKNEISVNPNNLDAHVVIAWSLVKMGDYQSAFTYAQNGIKLSRFDPRIIEILGEISYFQGKNAEALRYFQEYINFASEGGRVDSVYYLMGEIFIRQGRFRHADIALSTAVHWQPRNADWWGRLGYARESFGDMASAASAYEKALALNAGMVDVRRGLDRVRKALKR
ncbi:MAG: tetratricopeptide repeat protein [Treponema sp.]|jgi:tetratricopeptide (TPR) repeat protein|nr:tetratricopeptide repeat protein [Treponema sp.]